MRWYSRPTRIHAGEDGSKVCRDDGVEVHEVHIAYSCKFAEYPRVIPSQMQAAPKGSHCLHPLDAPRRRISNGLEITPCCSFENA
jgi:hypothetical protein